MYGRSTAARHLGRFDRLWADPIACIRFSDSSHRFFSAGLHLFQFDHRKHGALSSPVYGVSRSDHHYATDFRTNFL
jgi:hypothetical protein